MVTLYWIKGTVRGNVRLPREELRAARRELTNDGAVIERLVQS